MREFKYSLKQKVMLGTSEAVIIDRRMYPDKNINEYLVATRGKVLWIKEEILNEKGISDDN